ncbi:MAG TPA: hypothetical protein VNC82_19640 [Candidatus Limnocylindria bacterium]|nr:hypothetical protein [Candidatus Limnocylindria bacterium]
MRFAFIAAEKTAFPVTVLCRILAVSRAGFYAAQARPVAGRARRAAQLAVEIRHHHWLLVGRTQAAPSPCLLPLTGERVRPSRSSAEGRERAPSPLRGEGRSAGRLLA